MNKKIIFATALSLILVGCGGGGSDKNAAPKPPAPEMPNPPANPGNPPANPGNPPGNPPAVPELPEAGEEELSVSCSRSPASFQVNAGSKVTATYNFNKPFNGTGQVFATCQDLMVDSANVAITNGQASFMTEASENCTGVKLQVQLLVDGDPAQASCSWNVGAGNLQF